LYSNKSSAYSQARYNESMKADYTFIAPHMAEPHLDILESLFRGIGYNLTILPMIDPGAVDVGVRYVHNDMCYPAIVVIGQIMKAVLSGDYDTDKLAIILTQTGGGCRATNYVAMMREALEKAHLSHIPVIPLAFVPGGDEAGLKLSLKTVIRAFYTFIIGDVLMQCLLRTRPYEAVEGSAESLYDSFVEQAKNKISSMGFIKYTWFTWKVIRAFSKLKLVNDKSKPRFGIVGEILLKYHSTANNEIIKLIEKNGCEAVVLPLFDFFLYCMSGSIFQNKPLGTKKLYRYAMIVAIGLAEIVRSPVRAMLRMSSRFSPPPTIYGLAKLREGLINICNTMGEGWLLVAEMIELITSEVGNVITVQPFGCLPNHIVAKGVINELHRRFPSANIIALDYDPGASSTNQENRLRMAITRAKKNFVSNPAD
jgi:Uncharacterized protein conserved in bacteria